MGFSMCKYYYDIYVWKTLLLVVFLMTSLSVFS